MKSVNGYVFMNAVKPIQKEKKESSGGSENRSTYKWNETAIMYVLSALIYVPYFTHTSQSPPPHVFSPH